MSHETYDTLARVDHAELFERETDPLTPLSLALTFVTPKGRTFSTSISFNLGQRGVAGRKRYPLVLHLLQCRGLTFEQADRVGFRCLIGKHYLLRLARLGRDTWAIERARAVEPFEVAEGDMAALDALMRGAA